MACGRSAAQDAAAAKVGAVPAAPAAAEAAAAAGGPPWLLEQLCGRVALAAAKQAGAAAAAGAAGDGGGSGGGDEELRALRLEARDAVEALLGRMRELAACRLSQLKHARHLAALGQDGAPHHMPLLRQIAGERLRAVPSP